MRVLVTRPREDAAGLAEALTARGCEAVLEPLFHVEFMDTAALDLSGVHAFLLTSANGARALSRRDVSRELPVYAVGDATASAARDAGFPDFGWVDARLAGSEQGDSYWDDFMAQAPLTAFTASKRQTSLMIRRLEN